MAETPKSRPKSTHLSRSALAEKLGLSLKELTQLMIESGWLLHNDSAEKGKEWQLTAKGEFEGGVYRESKKFGQYIVWPESVVNHPAITEVQACDVSASSLAKTFHVSAKIMNRLLAEMAWLQPYAKGWQLSELGRKNGGVQTAHEETGVPYVLWPRSLVEHPALIQQVALYLGKNKHGEASKAIEIDGNPHYLSLDGRYLRSRFELMVANYLYISGLSYAYCREYYLSKQQSLLSDFYLPKSNVHIHFQRQDISPSELSQQLSRQQLAGEHSLKVVEVTPEDQGKLEQVLSKALLQLGVSEN